ILPEFGWTMGEEKFFGPGTIFQGYVKLRCRDEIYKATRLRLVFSGAESMLTYDVGPGLIRSQSNQLFGIRSTLWKRRQEDEELRSGKAYKFKFTIQMPLVQFPPSMNHSLYKCSYKLCAYLDSAESYDETPLTAHIPINYIPLIETRLLKSPIYLEDVKKRKKHRNKWMAMPAVTVKLHSVEYLSGDTIQAIICTTKPDVSASSFIAPSFKFDYSITMNLYQISQFHSDKEPLLSQLVGTQSYTLDETNETEQQHHLGLQLESYLPPSFEYSKIMSLSYKLRIKVYIKRARTSLSSAVSKQDSKKLKEAMTLPWPTSTMSMFETPIVIGTLGRGIRTDDELQAYTKFSSEHDPLPTPKFIENLQHEDTLPKYEPIRLPDYEEDGQKQCTVAASIVSSSASSITVG
ncbi:hypothetical protein CU098_000708, partial [Rhizopus stolonifer]